MQTAARRLSKDQKELATFQTPNYFYDVHYDAIFSFEFTADNGIFIMCTTSFVHVTIKRT